MQYGTPVRRALIRTLRGNLILSFRLVKDHYTCQKDRNGNRNDQAHKDKTNTQKTVSRRTMSAVGNKIRVVGHPQKTANQYNEYRTEQRATQQNCDSNDRLKNFHSRQPRPLPVNDTNSPKAQIGRASCRERV